MTDDPIISPEDQALDREYQKVSHLQPLRPSGLVYGPEQKAEAYRLFLNESMPLEAVALQLSLPIVTVTEWSVDGKWLERKKRLQDELLAQQEAQFRATVMKARPEILDRHIEAAGEIERKVIGAVKRVNVETDDKAIGKLKTASEALKNSAEVSARAGGITDAPFSGGSQKMPVIIVGAGPRGPSVAIVEPK